MLVNCEMCDASFGSQSELEDHLQKQHKSQTKDDPVGDTVNNPIAGTYTIYEGIQEKGTSCDMSFDLAGPSTYVFPSSADFFQIDYSDDEIEEAASVTTGVSSCRRKIDQFSMDTAPCSSSACHCGVCGESLLGSAQLRSHFLSAHTDESRPSGSGSDKHQNQTTTSDQLSSHSVKRSSASLPISLQSDEVDDVHMSSVGKSPPVITGLSSLPVDCQEVRRQDEDKLLQSASACNLTNDGTVNLHGTRDSEPADEALNSTEAPAACDDSVKTTSDPCSSETSNSSLVKLDTKEIAPLSRSSVDVQSRKKGRREAMPARGSREYREIRNADAKQRRENAAGRYACSYCDFKAPFPSKLKLHLQTNHTKGRFKCSLCTEVFDSQSDQRKHLASCHPLSHYCEQCGYTNKTAAGVRRHIQQVHLNGVQIQCTVPGCKTKLLKRQIRSHLSSVHGVKSVLSTDVTAQSAFQREEMSGDGQAAGIRCPHCQLQVKSIEELDTHVDLLHGRGVLCPIVSCEERVALDQLEMHISTMHPDFSLELPAQPKVLSKRVPSCGNGSVVTRSETMSSSTNTLAEDQMLLSEGEESDDETSPAGKEGQTRRGGLARRNEMGGYDCSTCASSFSSLYLLKKHVKRVHERRYAECKNRIRDLKYRCSWEECTKAFSTPGLLEDHLNKHKGITPYTCDHCSQSFFARARFAVHLSKYHQTSIRSYSAIGRSLPQMRLNIKEAETSNPGPL